MRRALLTAVVACLAAAPAAGAARGSGPGYSTARLDPAAVRAGAVASATSEQLWGADALDRIADDIVGASDMKVYVEDDATEWATFIPPDVPSEDVLGFVLLGSTDLYHNIFISPQLYPVFDAWLKGGATEGNEYPFAVAAMTLIHESFHWRLSSGDESTVNACALKYFPQYLESEFKVAPTIDQTTTTQVPVTTTKRTPVRHVKIVKKRVRVAGKWVTRTKRLVTITYVTTKTTTIQTKTVTTTVPNPEFSTIVADSADFYAHQPPPYNAGTCGV